MSNKIASYLYAKYRGFAPLACLESPRSDVLRGLRKWRWLLNKRRAGLKIDPSITIWCKSNIYKKLKIDNKVTLDQGVILWLGDEDCGSGTISLGSSVYVGPYTFIGSCHHLEIGENSMIGANSYLITSNHRTDRKNIPYLRQGYTGGDIRIGKNVWLGCHVVVLPGVTIGDNVIVGAGAVVTRDIPVDEKWAGVPARKIDSVLTI